MDDTLLLIPGPTNLSERVRDAMAGPQLPHVGSEFYSMFKETVGLARYVFKNEKGEQFVFTGSGTIGMESSVVSLVSRGDRTLTLINGYFGRRMLMLNQVHGAKADKLEFTGGKAADPDALRRRLRKTKYSTVFITHVDTSSSVLNPVHELVDECAKAGTMAVVDSVCSIGGVPLDFDRLGADVVFTASQKALAGAPGAVLLAVSKRAMERMEKRKSPIESYYMNLLKWKPVMDDPKMYLATPATQVLLALREALLEVKEEGIENRWERHRKLGELTRGAVEEWGQRFVAEEGHRADTVTSFWVEDGKAGPIQKTLESEHHVMVSRGIYDDKDRMIRVGHFGILQPEVLGRALGSMGDVMQELGMSARPVAVAKRRKQR
ncbi:MAG: alanine--glyoxylate aminotransferase family protein [Nitrososphaerota archaeon]|nr:alanine--glyoxylate aminotransferase family protein [Nitrososphaerota archaeon]MDG6960290.1 alanine--glyoxylate aminotransferase family protein [Nitrososphaerota archaeon]MDG6969410.1 alanine--glyoxylate aminotransferase family protein [Nitrososphaerota archaeon]MDG6982664.1 alanine--glyoxylate aminotransferase family protein [Nitrososphaerota archaeon]MDG7015393.1 alanine--glyoxylate aminotransferase family protein [Nitrososphaerota archaeon]